jgi:DNA-binding transcriptional ArsR family regulator
MRSGGGIRDTCCDRARLPTHSCGAPDLMPRAATTSDVFNAVAEPRRRAIIDVLADDETHTVGEVVRRLRLPQPVVSKHLGVLRAVGIVSASREGRRRLYRLNASEIKPVYDWARTYEHFWTHQLKRIKEKAEHKALERLFRNTDKNEEAGR